MTHVITARGGSGFGGGHDGGTLECGDGGGGGGVGRPVR